jgi:hypothetical protein
MCITCWHAYDIDPITGVASVNPDELHPNPFAGHDVSMSNSPLINLETQIYKAQGQSITNTAPNGPPNPIAYNLAFGNTSEGNPDTPKIISPPSPSVIAVQGPSQADQQVNQLISQQGTAESSVAHAFDPNPTGLLATLNASAIGNGSTIQNAASTASQAISTGLGSQNEPLGPQYGFAPLVTSTSGSSNLNVGIIGIFLVAGVGLYFWIRHSHHGGMLHGIH